MSNVLEIGLRMDNADLRGLVSGLMGGRDDVRLTADPEARLDVLAADLGEDPSARLAELAGLLERGVVREVILLGEKPDPELLIRAMRAGIKEFLSLPLQDGELEEALARISGRLPGDGAGEGKNGQVLSVVGASGGLGATTLAVNLAWELQALKPGSTVLVDLRRPEGEIPLFLDLEYSYTWGEVAENITRMDQTFLRSVLAEGENGLRILPGPSAGQWPQPTASAEAIRECLQGLCEMFEYVVVEDNRGLDAVSEQVLQASSVQWLLMSLSVTGLARGKRHLDEAARLDSKSHERTRLAVCKTVKGGEIGTEEAGEVLGKAVALVIPEDLPSTLSCINQGRPLAAAAPKSPVLKAVRREAREIAGASQPEEKAKSSSSSLFSKLGRSRKNGRGVIPQPA
jgi:pilus assembly protein CpaE